MLLFKKPCLSSTLFPGMLTQGTDTVASQVHLQREGAVGFWSCMKRLLWLCKCSVINFPFGVPIRYTNLVVGGQSGRVRTTHLVPQIHKHLKSHSFKTSEGLQAHPCKRLRQGDCKIKASLGNLDSISKKE